METFSFRFISDLKYLIYYSYFYVYAKVFIKSIQQMPCLSVFKKKKKLELRLNYSQVAGYKVKIQKAVPF